METSHSKNAIYSSVTDNGTKMCVDPGGSGAILREGENGGPGPPGGEEDVQLASDSGGCQRCQKAWRTGSTQHHNTKAPLCTEYISLYTSCATIGCTLEIVIVNRVLLCLSVSGE